MIVIKTKLGNVFHVTQEGKKISLRHHQNHQGNLVGGGEIYQGDTLVKSEGTIKLYLRGEWVAEIFGDPEIVEVRM